jgi:uncharacterized phage-associated protein
MDLLDFTKLIYLVDREALVRWGMPLTGDRYVSMERGMVLSETYDLSKRKFVQERLWDNFISEPNHRHELGLLADPDIDELSEDEIALIDEIYGQYGHQSTKQLIDRVHHALPEWVDVGKSSLIIRHETVLEKSGCENVAECLEEIEAVSYFERYSF